MKWRRISEEEVFLVLKNPDIIEEPTKGRSNAFKLIGKRYLKVTYKKVSEEILVISVVDKGR
jgi:hypothetical protein